MLLRLELDLEVSVQLELLLGFKLRNAVLSKDLDWYSADKIKGYVDDIIKGTAVGVGTYYGIKGAKSSPVKVTGFSRNINM